MGTKRLGGELRLSGKQWPLRSRLHDQPNSTNLVVPASSGKIVRHRHNCGGDRAANSALHIIAIGRLRTDQRTKEFVARRVAEGHSKLDAIRALKRYLVREVFTPIMQRQREINASRIAA